MRLFLVAAAVAVAAMPGAGVSAGSRPAPWLLSFGPAVLSPNGNGVNDVLHLDVGAPAGARLELRVYAWAGRLRGWKRIRTRMAIAPGRPAEWKATNAAGLKIRDRTYQVTVCYKDPGQRLPPVIPVSQQRPGAAEATVSRPPWRWSGCLGKPNVIRIERLAAYVDSTDSFEPGSRPPLVVSADRGQTTVGLVQDCSGSAFPGASLPQGLASGLYH